MTVLVFEDNLMWSARLAKTLAHLGHQAQVLSGLPSEMPQADAAIVNLGSETLRVEDLLPRLRAAGIWTIGHAGHKEKGLLAAGREAGCSEVVSNSTLTYKLDEVLERAAPSS